MQIVNLLLKNSVDLASRVQVFLTPALPFFHPLVVITGDIIQIALPAIAILFDAQRYYVNNKNGWELLNTVLKVLLTSIVTNLIKKLARGTSYDIRPNGHRGSFPSGHTSAVFGGALLIHQIFGSRYAVYAYGLACCTACTRMYGRYHHLRDVAAGVLTALSMNVLVDMIMPMRHRQPILFNNMAFNRPRAAPVSLLPRRM